MRGFSAEGEWLGDRKGLSGLSFNEVAEVEQTFLPLESVDLNDKDTASNLSLKKCLMALP